jgi:hypothetical protein
LGDGGSFNLVKYLDLTMHTLHEIHREQTATCEWDGNANHGRSSAVS